MLLEGEVAVVTDTDVVNTSLALVGAVALQVAVDVAADGHGVAHALAVLYDGAVGGQAREQLGELQLGLHDLIHREVGDAFEALVVDFSGLLCEGLADVLVEGNFLHVNLCEG